MRNEVPKALTQDLHSKQLQPFREAAINTAAGSDSTLQQQVVGQPFEPTQQEASTISHIRADDAEATAAALQKSTVDELNLPSAEVCTSQTKPASFDTSKAKRAPGTRRECSRSPIDLELDH